MKNRLLYLLIACVLSLSIVACGTTDEEKNSQGTEDTSNTEEMPSTIEGVYWLFVDVNADEYDNFTTGYYFDGSGNYKYATLGYSYDAQYKIEKVDTSEESVVYTIGVYKDGDLWEEHFLTLKDGVLSETIDFGDGSGITLTLKPVDENTFFTAFQ